LYQLYLQVVVELLLWQPQLKLQVVAVVVELVQMNVRVVMEYFVAVMLPKDTASVMLRVE
jgi:hypothetical protein